MSRNRNPINICKFNVIVSRERKQKEWHKIDAKNRGETLVCSPARWSCGEKTRCVAIGTNVGVTKELETPAKAARWFQFTRNVHWSHKFGMGSGISKFSNKLKEIFRVQHKVMCIWTAWASGPPCRTAGCPTAPNCGRGGSPAVCSGRGPSPGQTHGHRWGDGRKVERGGKGWTRGNSWRCDFVTWLKITIDFRRNNELAHSAALSGERSHNLAGGPPTMLVPSLFFWLSFSSLRLARKTLSSCLVAAHVWIRHHSACYLRRVQNAAPFRSIISDHHLSVLWERWFWPGSHVSGIFLALEVRRSDGMLKPTDCADNQSPRWR